MSGPVLRLDSVSRSFPGARALSGVSLQIPAGEVRALMGENGAGKSTLIKIITGAISADSGAVWIDGVELRRPSPRSAQRLGVRAIHQERQIAADLTAAENVYLDSPPRTRLGLTTRTAAIRAAGTLFANLGIELDPAAPASALSAAQQQLVELARAVSASARLVIMDEPTASLHRNEVETLFAVIRRLKAESTAVLYISHHLDEVFEVADRATVLRNGRHIGDVDIAGTSRAQLVSLMFGRDVSQSRLARVKSEPRPALRATGVRLGTAPGPIDLTVNHGEVLALSGGTGSGASELAGVLAAVQAAVSGEVRLSGGPRLRSRAHAAKSGVGYLPADRKRDGLLLERSISENLFLVPQAGLRNVMSWPALVRKRARLAAAAGAVHAASVDQAVMTLSGGNQQKVILARWMIGSSSVLVLDEPTAGVDVAAKFEIYRRLLDLAAAGMAIVVVSSDYEEIACLADRVVLMRDGAIVHERNGADASPQELYALETGAA